MPVIRRAQTQTVGTVYKRKDLHQIKRMYSQYRHQVWTDPCRPNDHVQMNVFINRKWFQACERLSAWWVAIECWYSLQVIVIITLNCCCKCRCSWSQFHWRPCVQQWHWCAATLCRQLMLQCDRARENIDRRRCITTMPLLMMLYLDAPPLGDDGQHNHLKWLSLHCHPRVHFPSDHCQLCAVKRAN